MAAAKMVVAELETFLRAEFPQAFGGGDLTIEWLRSGHVVMTGPVATSFAGELSADLVRVAA